MIETVAPAAKKVWTEAELQAMPDGEALLPGFRYPIEDLFKDWDGE